MKLIPKGVTGLILLTVSLILVAEETVKAPRGWDDGYVGATRVVTNGNVSVHIMPWQNLEGLSVEQWLTQLKSKDPLNGQLVSSAAVKPEPRVSGSYSVNRKIRLGGSEGTSVLYGCAGQAGHARLMTFEVLNGGIFEMLKGSSFVEKVCKQEPRGSGSVAGTVGRTSKKLASVSDSQPVSATKSLVEPVSNDDSVGTSMASDVQLKELNQALPKANKPVNATIVLKKSWVGFPAMRIDKAHMVLEFPQGTELACSDWSPAGEFPSKQRRQSKDCAFPEIDNRVKVSGFKPGERIALAFGRIAAFGLDGLEGSTSVLSGGDLVLDKDGSIAVGSWNAAHMSTTVATARATSVKRDGLKGRYYLDGYTISIATNDGDVIHGLIGYSNRNQTKKIDAVFLNGKHYWDRNK